MNKERTERIAVVGMGNLLMSDDGVGVHVLQRLGIKNQDGVELIDAGTAIIHTADCLRGIEHVVVIDALKGGEPPGTIYMMSGDDVMENDYTLSVHSLGLKTALKFLALNEDPVEWTLVGIEPDSLVCGMHLSPTVEAALPDAVHMVEQLIEEWQA